MLETLEYSAVVFNIGYVILAARGSVWCWPLGIVGSLLSIWLFVEIKLYAESVLFVYYVVVGFYGWMQWTKQRTARDDLKIRDWELINHLYVVLGGYISTYFLFLILKHFTDAAMPLLDSFTTVFSFIATWLTAKRFIENWIYWIVIDAFTVYLYFSRGLEIYAYLSVIYTIVAAYGLINWNRDFKKQTHI